MSVGNRIRYARKYRKYTQARLAIEIGSKQNTPHTRIAQYEGEYHNPTNDTLREIAEVLNVNPKYFNKYDPYELDDVMRIFFELERLYGFIIKFSKQGRVKVIIEDERLEKLLNSLSKTRDDMTDDAIRDLALVTREHQELLKPMLKNIRKTIASAESIQIHLSGEKNILDFPEFSDIDKARTLFNTLEEKEVLLNIIGDAGSGKTDISIGTENELDEMKNCSVIKTSYKVGDNIYGTIGIIGPTRMDYGQVISVLNGMAKNIENIMNSAAKGKNKAIEGKDKLNE